MMQAGIIPGSWWNPITVEETGSAKQPEGVEIPHPKGVLSSMNAGDAFEQLKQRLKWSLIEPTDHPDVLEIEAPIVESAPFQRLVPQARLNISDGSVYEVELAVDGDDERLVVDKARITTIDLDLDAHWPGTIGNPGPLVRDEEEYDPLNLFLPVNDDDDNGDHVVDHDAGGSPTIDPQDDEVLTLVVRRFEPPISGEGTLELTLSEGLRLFSEDGTEDIPVPLSVDLANPEGSLADVVNNDVTLLVEADTEADDAVIALMYNQAGQEIVRDEVHLLVFNLQIRGGFGLAEAHPETTPSESSLLAEPEPQPLDTVTPVQLTGPAPQTFDAPEPQAEESTPQPTVQWAEAIPLGADRWMLADEFNSARPLSVLIPIPESLQGDPFSAVLHYTRSGSSDWNQALRLHRNSFNFLAELFNVVLHLFGIEWSGDQVAERLSVASGIETSVLLGGQYFLVGPLEYPTEDRPDIEYDLQLCRGMKCSQDRDTLLVTRIDLDIWDQEKEEYIDDEKLEDDPGKVVVVNFDDDDCDGTGYGHGEVEVISDKDDENGIVAPLQKPAGCLLPDPDGDNDLIPLRIAPIRGLSGIPDISAAFVLDFDTEHIAIWKSPYKHPEDKVLSGTSLSDESGAVPVSQEQILWVEGTLPHGHTAGSLISVRLMVNDKPSGQASVRVIVPDMIFAIFGLGAPGTAAGYNILKSHLSDTTIHEEIWEPENIWVVEGTHQETRESLYYSVAICEKEKRCEQWFKIALQIDENSVVVYQGHSNMGLGPAFDNQGTLSPWIPSNITNVESFMNTGRDAYPPRDNNKGGFTGIDWAHLRSVDYLYFTTIEPDRIPEFPLNYVIPYLNIERFPNTGDGVQPDGHVDPGEFFALRQGWFCTGSYEDKCHYEIASGELEAEKVLIVYTGSDDVPELDRLKYKFLLMKSCNSGRNYIETFPHGVFFYTKATSKSATATTIFIQEVLNGKNPTAIKEGLFDQVKDDTRKASEMYDFYDFTND